MWWCSFYIVCVQCLPPACPFVLPAARPLQCMNWAALGFAFKTHTVCGWRRRRWRQAPTVSSTSVCRRVQQYAGGNRLLFSTTQQPTCVNNGILTRQRRARLPMCDCRCRRVLGKHGQMCMRIKTTMGKLLSFSMWHDNALTLGDRTLTPGTSNPGLFLRNHIYSWQCENDLIQGILHTKLWLAPPTDRVVAVLFPHRLFHLRELWRKCSIIITITTQRWKKRRSYCRMAAKQQMFTLLQFTIEKWIH